MALTAVILRELRLRTRRRSTHRVRILAAVIAIGLTAILLLVSQAARAPSSAGRALFTSLAVIGALLSLVEGLRNTVDAISAEKREGTLGLLFLTGMRGMEVVLGKLAARSLNSAYALMAIFPALAIPLVLGGVMPGEVARLAMALATALFFTSALGLAVSAWSWTERNAWSLALLVLLASAGVPALSRLAGWWSFPSFEWLSPIASFSSLSDSVYRVKPSAYWFAISASHGLAWGLLCLAGAKVSRAWQDARGRSGVGHARRRPTLSEAQRRILLDRNPILWLASRDAAQRRYLWAFTAVALGAQGALIFVAGNLVSPSALFIPSLILVQFVLRVWIGLQAGACVVEARQTGAIEMWAATPLTTKEMIQGQQLALSRLFLWPTALLAGAPFLLALGWFIGEALKSGSEQNPLAFVGVGLSSMVQWTLLALWCLLDLVAVAFVGMYLAVVAKKAGRATGYAVLYSLVSPIVFGLICCVPNFLISLVVILVCRAKLEPKLARLVRPGSIPQIPPRISQPSAVPAASPR